MAQTLNLKIKGLYTHPNQMSEVPLGALNRADNLVIDRPSIAESRRGQRAYGDPFVDPPEAIFSFDDHLIVHQGDILSLDSDQNGTFTDYSGSFISPSDILKIHSIEASKNLYLTTSEGIKVLDDLANQFYSAGAPKGLFGTASLENPGFMSNNVNVAYRIIWGRTDANQNEIVGAPSQRLIVSNETGFTANVDLTWYIPDGVTEDYFFRVFRSGESASISSEPDDELQLVKEGNPTSTDISNGYINFTDIVPTSLRGAFLYTSPSQQGINQANDQPPLAMDISYFKNHALYFNTISKQRYFITLIAVGDNTLGGSFGYQTNTGDTTNGLNQIDGLEKAASKIIQDLTYTADTVGPGGNDITITYTGGGTAGAEFVTVVGSQISVQIQSGVSTATQVKTAVDASGPAAALVNVAISGVGGNPQITQSQTSLEDGFDTSLLNIGMRVEGTNIPASTFIATIVDSNSITVTNNATGTGTVALEFQDVFRINSLAYYATTATDANQHEFKVFLDGTPAENIENTAIELIKVINLDTTNTIVYAYYTSGFEDLPGQFLIEERGIGGAEFSLTSTNGESFSPILENTGTNNVSSNDEKPHYVYISKPQQPEAVPLLNFLPVGSENHPILRGIALRDSVFIIKQDGIFRMTGEDITNFRITLFDSSIHLIAPESAVVLNNQIFMMADVGIVAISDSGVQIISEPIKATLLQLSSDLYPAFETSTFGVTYESDAKYILCTVSEQEDTFATQAFVFNTLTSSFTKWIMNRSCGLVNPFDNKLYMGNPENNSVYKERKLFDRLDYADEEFPVEIVSSTDLEVELVDTSDIEVGFTLKQEAREAIVTEVIDSTTITVDVQKNWEAGDAIVYKPIRCVMEWVPNTSDNPGILKHWSEITLLFRDGNFRDIDVGFQSNFADGFDTVTVDANSGVRWGGFPWGQRPWGGRGGRPLPIRTYVPLEKQRASWLNFKIENEEAFTSFALSGISAIYEPMSSRFR